MNYLNIYAENMNLKIRKMLFTIVYLYITFRNVFFPKNPLYLTSGSIYEIILYTLIINY